MFIEEKETKSKNQGAFKKVDGGEIRIYPKCVHRKLQKSVTQQFTF